MMKTPIDYYIQAAAGYHYCKLLPPARMMEWAYTDISIKMMELRMIKPASLFNDENFTDLDKWFVYKKKSKILNS